MPVIDLWTLDDEDANAIALDRLRVEREAP